MEVWLRIEKYNLYDFLI